MNCRKKIYDITQPLSEKTPILAGDPKIVFKPRQLGTKTSGVTITEITLGSHSGTHIDAPYHVLKDQPGIQGFQPIDMIGRALVVQTDTFLMNPYGYLRLSESCKALLFKNYHQKQETTVITQEVLDAICAKGIRVIGVDALSIDRIESKDLPNHRLILRRGIWIVEGLILEEVDAGAYDYIITPLKIQVQDGAPVRALLMNG